jgi:hypothetical protein
MELSPVPDLRVGEMRSPTGTPLWRYRLGMYGVNPQPDSEPPKIIRKVSPYSTRFGQTRRTLSRPPEGCG